MENPLITVRHMKTKLINSLYINPAVAMKITANIHFGLLCWFYGVFLYIYKLLGIFRYFDY